MTSTVPCSIPTSTVWENKDFTSSGVALVAISTSEISLPNTKSRTDPPTNTASCPAFFKVCKTGKAATKSGTDRMSIFRLNLFIF